MARTAEKNEPLAPESFPDIEPLLAEASFRCDTVAHALVPRPWVPVPHRSLFDKLYVPTEGRGWMSIENKRWEMFPGRVFFFAAGAIQQGETDDDIGLKKVWVHFESFTTRTLHLLRLFPPPPCLQGESAKKITELSLAMHEEWSAQRPLRHLAVQALLLQILVIAYRGPAHDHVPHEGLLSGKNEPQQLPLGVQIRRIRAALQAIYQRGDQPLSLADLARSVHLHPAYFNHLFRNWVGMPPMKFLEQHRIRRAKELLSLTDRTVADIAAEVGYGDPLYFSRAFRRVTGAAPTEYRRGIQQPGARE
jgi:AraC family transcriptional regulator, arabinose operon regulatory protein